jgi:hypothetical protein
VDTEQISREMSVKRASIDRKLDLLSQRTIEARREALQGTVAVAVVSVAAITAIWLWRQNRIRRARRILQSSVRL